MRSLLIIGMLVLAFSLTFIIRLQPLDYVFELAVFDPFFNNRATEFFVESGLPAYLDWQDDCLKFYNNKRPIKTASDLQARSKIFNTSVDSWKNYEKYLSKYLIKLRN